MRISASSEKKKQLLELDSVRLESFELILAKCFRCIGLSVLGRVILTRPSEIQTWRKLEERRKRSTQGPSKNATISAILIYRHMSI